MTDTLARLAARLATVERRLDATTRTAQLAYSSIEDGAVEVYDSDGSLRAVIGQQGDGTSGVAVVNGPPPPQPTAPIVASILGGLAVSWPGTFADGSVVPLDWTRLEVHTSAIEGFDLTSATLRGTLESPQGGTLTVPTTDPLYVRFLGRNTSGSASVASDQSGPAGPAPVVAQAVLDGIITTAALADDAVTAAKVAVAAIDNAALADSAVTAAKIGEAAVNSSALAANAVTLGKIAAAAVTDLQLAEDAVTTAAIATGAVTANELTVGSTVNLIPDPSFEGAYSEQQRAGGVRSVVAGGNGSAKALQIALPFDEHGYESEDRFPLLVQEPVVGGGQLYLSVDTTDGGEFYVSFYDGNGAEADFVMAGTRTAITGTSWHQLSDTIIVPDVATTMTLLLYTSGNGTTTRFDNAVARPMLGSSQIAAGAVTTLKMTANSINGDRIAAGTLAATKIVAKSITAVQIYGSTITAAELAAGSVTATAIAANTITAAKIAAGTITAYQIAANTITAGNLAASSVTATALAAGSVQTAALAADAVTAGKIAASAVTAREIAALAVTANAIAASAVTADKLAAGSVTATSLAADAINGKTITGVTVTGGTVTGGVVETAATGQRIKLVPATEFDVIDLGGGTINPPGIEFYSGDTAEQEPGYLVSYSGDEFGGTVTELSTPDVGHGTANLQLVGGDSFGRVANFTGVAGGAVTWLDPTTFVARLTDGTQFAVGYQFGANADGVYASLCNIYTATTAVHFALGGAVIYAPGGTLAKWQTVTTFGTSWATGATSGTYQAIRYRRDAQDNVHIQGTMRTTAASAASTAWTLATGYRPATAQRIPVAINTSSTITAGIATIATTGAVTITPTPATSADVYFNAFLPLGNIS